MNVVAATGKADWGPTWNAARCNRRWGASGDGRGGEVEWGRRMAARRGEATTDEVEWGDIFLDRDRRDLEMSGSIRPDERV